MTDTLPTRCGRGHCTEPATALVHIDYPENPITGGRPFRWSKPMCDECAQIERDVARLGSVHPVVSTEALPVAVAS